MKRTDKIDEFSRVLRPFLPKGTEDYVARFLVRKIVLFTISEDRKSKMGDYRQPHNGDPHLISVNGSLNKYAFLITTIHELAHLTTWEQFRNRVKPHGNQWQQQFQRLMRPLMGKDIFPDDVEMAVNNYMENVKASSCSDDRLYRVLRRYDKNPPVLVEHLRTGQKFQFNGKTFVKGKKLRKRFECLEHGTSKKYLVPGIVEID